MGNWSGIFHQIRIWAYSTLITSQGVREYMKSIGYVQFYGSFLSVGVIPLWFGTHYESLNQSVRGNQTVISVLSSVQ